jgi:glycosyltransferase involved in cell wall biosynthesis
MSDKLRPKVSIIITAYNYQRYVEASILSCLGQTGFDAYEILLIDDGSSDQTATIARSFEPDIKVISIENSGVEYASNLGLSLAQGEYLLRLDADDRLCSDYLAVMVAEFEKNSPAFLYSEYTQIDMEGNPTKRVYLPDFDIGEIQNRGDFLATGTLYCREAVIAVDAYNERVKNCGLENYELILKLISSGYVGKCVHSPLFEYRIHDSNMSRGRRDSLIDYGSRLAQEFGLRKYQTNKNHPYGLKV